MIELFHTLLTQPLFNALVFFYNTIAFQDFGIAIIILTIGIRTLLFPLSHKAIKSQRALSELQPKIKKLQEEHKDDKEKQAQALMQFYQEHKVNPFGGCLPILVQIPILFALYSVFLNGLDPEYLNNLYTFVARPDMLDPFFFGLIDLSSRSIILALIAGALQFFQSKMILPQMNLAKGGAKGGAEAVTMMVSKQMLYFIPVITVVISITLPAGLPLYWATTTIFTIFQQFVIMRPHHGGAKESG